jgi:hypothetical protein
MFDNALRYAGLQIARFQFRSDVDTVQPLTTFFTGAKSVLITLPAGYEEAIIAGDALHAFRNRLMHLNLTVVHTSTRATSLSDFPRSEVIRISQADINRVFLPTRELLQRIIHQEYDAAVDLNLDFVLHTAYICKASRAKVRVGFVHPWSDVFFNVQFNLDRQRTPQVVYEKFAQCLAMF